jgi:DNA-binding transcriptional ArsR family regulator
MLGMSQSNTSRHLNRLKNAGIITCEKNPSGFIIKLANGKKVLPITTFNGEVIEIYQYPTLDEMEKKI